LRRALPAVACGVLVCATPAVADRAAALHRARLDAGATIAAGAVVDHGRVVWTGSEGGGATTASVFSLASLTKTYTATLVMRFVQQGRIRLSDRIGRWLAGRIPRPAARVTVRELLDHTSGLPDYLDDPHVSAAIGDPRHHWTEAELLRAVRAPRHRGTFSYSNTNYVLLGAMLRRVAHESEGALVDQRVVAPLHLTGTSMLRRASFAARVAGGGRLGTDVWGPIWADGGIVATASDVGRFLDALVVAHRLLSPATVARMLPRPGAFYGLGIYSDTQLVPGETFYGHDGSYGGWFSYGLSDPLTGMTYVVLLRGGNDDVETALRDLVAG
jgi:D-alanyl-D-alanine carboxypeptidase